MTQECTTRELMVQRLTIRDSIDRSRHRPGIASVALLVTTAALFVSLVVAVTTVSIGIARADTLGHIAGGGRYALGFVLVAVVAAMGGLTAAMVHGERNPAGQE